MEFDWDETKRLFNLARYGFDFADVARFDWDAAEIGRDLRFDYGEERCTAYCIMDGRLMVILFTRRAAATRVVSFRRANRKERRIYGP